MKMCKLIFPGCQFFFLMLLVTVSEAQQKEKYNVAIFLYQNVELLDFAGPSEVFAQTPGFTTYTVSVDGKEVLSQGFVKVQPQYSITDAPVPDIFVFPGGNSGPSSQDPRVLNWIKERVAAGTVCVSVCSGAGIVARTGLFDGLNITTWYGNIQRLQAILPNSKVLANTRFVDNGNIITTAGVSAGIDGSLHVVSRIKGMDIAKGVAKYMEYDKWDPENGLVDYKNYYIESHRSKYLGLPAPIATKKFPTAGEIPYEGEMKNLAMELKLKGLVREAATILEQNVKWYPNSGSSFSQLAVLYRELGRAAPLDEEGFIKLIETGKTAEAFAEYEKVQKVFPGWKIFSENVLNNLGYDFMRKQDYATAKKVFELNVKAYPMSFAAWDSFGEAYLKAGDKKQALVSYKRSLELNPKNESASDAIKSIGNNQ
ncbi:MAG: DJ-1/PfpI family protein [Chitinophagaceae bacterium]|nr:DJ-1/PfpI family protein [Chitinophagaceae bacterium]